MSWMWWNLCWEIAYIFVFLFFHELIEVPLYRVQSRVLCVFSDPEICWSSSVVFTLEILCTGPMAMSGDFGLLTGGRCCCRSVGNAWVMLHILQCKGQPLQHRSVWRDPGCHSHCGQVPCSLLWWEALVLLTGFLHMDLCKWLLCCGLGFFDHGSWERKGTSLWLGLGSPQMDIWHLVSAVDRWSYVLLGREYNLKLHVVFG